jgi:hypothetical protein
MIDACFCGAVTGKAGTCRNVRQNEKTGGCCEGTVSRLLPGGISGQAIYRETPQSMTIAGNEARRSVMPGSHPFLRLPRAHATDPAAIAVVCGKSLCASIMGFALRLALL